MTRTNITKEFTNTQKLNVFFNETTGYITIENNDEIIFLIYDDGNWEAIKIAIQTAIDEHQK